MSAKKNALPKVRRTFYSLYVKRLLDIALSGFALVVLSPVFLIVCILELIFHGRPVIYKTRRPGKDGKIFYMYKFRSMTNERGADGRLLPESERLTRFGYVIRKTSVDELPGLVNILKGDMSVIGPRPLLVEYLQYYSSRHAMRHCVRPGLALERITRTDSKTWTWREQFENDISDLMYYFECAREKLSYRLESMVETVNGLDFIPPSEIYQNLAGIRGGQWMDLFKELEKTSEYEYLILDLSDNVLDLWDILRNCTRIYTISRDDGLAMAKIEQYEKALEYMNYGDINVKTTKWKLPIFRELPARIEELTYGDLAAYIKKQVFPDLL